MEMTAIFDGRSVLTLSPKPELRNLVKKILNSVSLKINAVEAAEALNALERGKNKEFDIVVLNEKLDKMSGGYVISRLQEIKHIAAPKFYILILEDGVAEPSGLASNVIVLKALPPEEEFRKLLLEHLEKSLTATKPVQNFKVDVNFINPFIAATVEVLKVTCQTTATKDKVFLRAGDQVSGDISALVGMVSDAFKGSMGIAFQKRCFLHVVNSMLGEKYKDITKDNQDAAGEICNQIFGMAKTKLNEMGHNIKPAIPSIIVGDGHRIKHLLNGPVIAVRFETEQGAFIVEAAVM